MQAPTLVRDVLHSTDETKRYTAKIYLLRLLLLVDATITRKQFTVVDQRQGVSAVRFAWWGG